MEDNITENQLLFLNNTGKELYEKDLEFNRWWYLLEKACEKKGIILSQELAEKTYHDIKQNIHDTKHTANENTGLENKEKMYVKNIHIENNIINNLNDEIKNEIEKTKIQNVYYKFKSSNLYFIYKFLIVMCVSFVLYKLIYNRNLLVSNDEIYLITYITIISVLFYYYHNKVANKNLLNFKNQLIKESSDTKKKLSLALDDRDLWRKTLIEKNQGFPTLLNLINEYEEKRDNASVKELLYKKHRALKAASTVREETKRRRESEAKLKKALLLIDYFENLYPQLIELRNEEEIDNESIKDIYSLEDDTMYQSFYMESDDYKNLSSCERNQIALDRFMKRKKSKWMIGKMYERYIGYLYEMQNYDVEYQGIKKKYNDLGIDLICTKNDNIILIQCKNWAKFKNIYEKHIFQFFGTYFHYKKDIKINMYLQYFIQQQHYRI